MTLKLDDSVTKLKYISDSYAKKLSILGIKTIKDLITYFPRDYIDTTQITKVEALLNFPDIEKDYTIKASVAKFNNIRLRGSRTLQKVVLEDSTGAITATFFNQPFLSRVFKVGKTYLINGSVKQSGNKFDFYPKDYEEYKKNRGNITLGRISPKYKLTAGITKKWLQKRIYDLVENSLGSVADLDSEIPNVSLNEDIKNAHFPKDEKSLNTAIEELTMLELINLHLKLLKKSSKNKKNKFVSISVKENMDEITKFIKALPFELTKDQQDVINKVLTKLQNNEPVNALIQGDVGSGKTIVAFIIALSFLLNGNQVTLLAPTTVLANQHFNTISKYLKSINKSIKAVLVTGNTKTEEEYDLLIGTSAVLARKAKLIKNLGLVLVDEQHRFGVKQREELLHPFKLSSNQLPHLIDLTATPIPRTVAEGLFSSVDVFTINSKPSKRKEIKTHIVPKSKRKDSYKWIRNQIVEKGDQVYWVTPLVEESQKIEAKSVKEVEKELAANIKGVRIAILHGKLKSDDKNRILEDFKDHKIDLLVSTSVIEVGIDVPNATIMVIDNAERFGLAQLHQIRGRVGRGEKLSYCFLFEGESITDQAKKRLEFISKNNEGIKLAEFDLQQRGPGEVYGTKQSGIPDLKIARLNDIELIRESRKIAEKLYNDNIKSIKLFS